MSKILQIASASVVSLALMGGVAAADTISNTGPGSDNSIIHDNTSNCTVNNNNHLDVNNQNNQNSNSGNASGSNNTTGGNSQSGNSSNTSSSTTNVDINNHGCDPAVASTTPPVTTTKTPTAKTTTPTTAVLTSNSTLPNTGSGSITQVVGYSAGLLGFVAIASRFGAATLKRFNG